MWHLHHCGVAQWGVGAVSLDIRIDEKLLVKDPCFPERLLVGKRFTKDTFALSKSGHFV